MASNDTPKSKPTTTTDFESEPSTNDSGTQVYLIRPDGSFHLLAVSNVTLTIGQSEEVSEALIEKAKQWRAGFNQGRRSSSVGKALTSAVEIQFAVHQGSQSDTSRGCGNHAVDPADVETKEEQHYQNNVAPFDPEWWLTSKGKKRRRPYVSTPGGKSPPVSKGRKFRRIRRRQKRKKQC